MGGRRRTLALAGAALAALSCASAAVAEDTEVSIEQVDPSVNATVSASSEYDVYLDAAETPASVGDPFGLLPEPRSSGSASVINQIGDGNLADAEVIGARNRTAQVQEGSGNVSTVFVAGDFNDVVTSQLGSGNTTAVSVAGDDTSTATIQLGAGLSISVDRVGPGGPPITLVQENGD